MGCDFNGTTSWLTRTASPINHNAAYTACGWVYCDSVTTGSIQIVYMARTNDFLDSDYLYVTDTGDLMFKVDTAGAGSATELVAAVSAGTWLWVAIVRTSATSARAYVGTTASAEITVNVAVRGATTAEFHGAANDYGWLDGRLSRWTYWSRALSTDELAAQSRRSMPINANGLHSWCPMLEGNRLADLSGNGRPWTNTATSDGADPPVAWGAPIVRVGRAATIATIQRFGTTVKNAWLDAIESHIGTAPTLEIRTGSVPADCAAADNGIALVVVELPSDWMAGASSSSKGIAGGPWTATASATGTASHWRIKAGSTCHMQGTITATGGGGDMTVDNTSIAAGQSFQVAAFTLTPGASEL